MIDGRPAVFISHSEKFKAEVAIPLRDFIETLGLVGVLVSESPRPAHKEWSPDGKVDHYLDRSSMFVALVTPDDELSTGELHPRQNVVEEIQRARNRPHLCDLMQVFVAPKVKLPSNLNPAYDPLDVADVAAVFPRFEAQAREWGVIPRADDTALTQNGSQIERGTGTPATPTSEALHSTDQAADALAWVQRHLAGGGDRTDGARFELLRAHLAVVTAYAELGDAELLGAHELNRLYRVRDAIRLSGPELKLIARTLLRSLSAVNAPGWFWIATRPRRELKRLLVTLALGDDDAGVRGRAIELLANSDARITDEDLLAVIRAGLSSEAGYVRRATLDLLEKQGTPALLAELNEPLDESDDADRVVRVRAAIALRDDPADALARVLDQPGALTDELQQALLRRSRQLPQDALEGALTSKRKDVRLLAVRALARSRRLRKGRALEIMASDPSGKVRGACLDAAVQARWRLSPADVKAALNSDVKDGVGFDEEWRLAVRGYGLLHYEELIALAEGHAVENWHAYAGLATRHWDRFHEQLQQDVADDFDGLRLRARERLRARILGMTIGPAEAAGRRVDELVTIDVEAKLDELTSLEESTARFVGRMLRRAAAEGIALHGGERHRGVVREWLDLEDDLLTAPCVEFLSRQGDVSDVPRLLAAAKRGYGEVAVAAARAALSLASDFGDAASPLLLSGDEPLVAAALESLGSGSPSEEALDTALQLLDADRDGVRASAARYLVEHLSESQSRTLLEIYPERSRRYYYNVIVVLDRTLYAPRWVQRALARAS